MRVTLVLTHQCNLGCPYCYAGRKFERAMPAEVGWKALRMAFEDPDGGPVSVSFFGGEPMLRFADMAAYTRLAVRWSRRSGRPVRFQVTTNGTVLDERHLRFFRYYGFRVAVSVDGIGETHDRQRPFRSGRPSSGVVWRNLRRAARWLPDLEVLAVVTPGNVASLAEAVEEMASLGVRRVSLLPEVEQDWPASAREDLRSSYHRMARLALRAPGGLVLDPFARRFSPAAAGGSCRFGVGEVSVSPAGNLYPCARLVGTDSRPELRLGSVDSGPSLAAAEGLGQEARSRLASCGAEGPCACVAWMPGDVAAQMERYRFFQQVADEAVSAARAVAVLMEVV